MRFLLLAIFVAAGVRANDGEAEAAQRDADIKAGLRLGVTRPYVRDEDKAKCHGECAKCVTFVSPFKTADAAVIGQYLRKDISK